MLQEHFIQIIKSALHQVSESLARLAVALPQPVLACHKEERMIIEPLGENVFVGRAPDSIQRRFSNEGDDIGDSVGAGFLITEEVDDPEVGIADAKKEHMSCIVHFNVVFPEISGKLQRMVSACIASIRVYMLDFFLLLCKLLEQSTVKMKGKANVFFCDVFRNIDINHSKFVFGRPLNV